MYIDNIKKGMMIACTYAGYHKVTDWTPEGRVEYDTLYDQTGKKKITTSPGHCNIWTAEPAEDVIRAEITKKQEEIKRLETLLDGIVKGVI